MNLQVGVKILLQNTDGNFLLLKRAEAFAHGGSAVWDIPGGRIDPAEPLLNALTREVQEEAGLQLEAAPRLLSAQDIFVEAKGLHVVRLTYTGQAVGEVELSDEHSAFEWMSKDETLKLENLDPYLKAVLEHD